MNNTNQEIRNMGPGLVTLAILVAVTVLGSLVVLGITLFWSQSESWSALVGWWIAGFLGLTGWWTYRKALSGGNHKRFMKYVVGGMLLRLVICGVGTGIFIGFGWLDATGFVASLLVGIVVFLGIEVVALERCARRLSNKSLPGEPYQIKGVACDS